MSKASIDPPIFALVAGEVSGDILGAGLIRAIKSRIPQAKFVGIGGEKMIAEGLHELYPMERLAVMGIVPILLRYLELHKVRRDLIKRWSHEQPLVFIGIDAPEFNTGLELKLRRAGVKTVHYVSPSVWAWRKKRIKTIAKAVDLMLTLLPFEAEFYRQHRVPVEFVGHPLANMIDLEIDTAAHRGQFGLLATDEVLAILPGSRGSEIKYIGPVYLQVMQRLHEKKPNLKFIVPMVNDRRQQQFSQLIEQYGKGLDIQVVIGQSREVLASSNAVLLASGTATLEAMLLKKPMVVGFKWSSITHALIAPLVSVDNVSLPNLLAGKPLVEEFIQDDCTVDNLLRSILSVLDAQHSQNLKLAFTDIHLQLRQNANEKAAIAVLKLAASAET